MKAIITVGMGFGDEGKGSTVAALCRSYGAKLVVRYSGGPQCGHNVIGPNGERHPFAQFGAGTFENADTYLDRGVIIDPNSMKREAEALIKQGVPEPYSKLVVHPRCLVTTDFHKMVNKAANNPNVEHGTCGMGVGVARKYWLQYGEDAIFAEDLNFPWLVDKLELLRQRLLYDSGFDERQHDQPLVRGASVFQVATKLCENSSLLRIGKNLNPWSHQGTVVFEGAQGMLLDEYWGYHPHTTWSDVTPRAAIESALSWGIRDEDIKILGITRCYHTRHGNGPLPSANKSLDLVDPGNPENRWQGAMRFGHFDRGLFTAVAKVIERYGYDFGWAVNHLDEYQKLGGYVEHDGAELRGFVFCGGFPVVPCTIPKFLEKLGELAPVVMTGYDPHRKNIHLVW